MHTMRHRGLLVTLLFTILLSMTDIEPNASTPASLDVSGQPVKETRGVIQKSR